MLLIFLLVAPSFEKQIKIQLCTTSSSVLRLGQFSEVRESCEVHSLGLLSGDGIDIPQVASYTTKVSACFITGKEVDDVEYKLYNREHEGVQLTGNSSEKFIEDLPCKFISHGWTGDDTADSVQIVKNSYLNCSDVNVITINWKNESKTLNYIKAAKDTEEVGKAVGRKMVELVEAGSCSLDSLHCIGFSLGAHVCSDAAKYVQETLGKNISRVTGLDPAGPLFELNFDRIAKFSQDVADFVDAVHTDSIFGHRLRLAIVDFYVNGAINPQPGCKGARPGCSHMRAPDLFAESICNPEAFLSILCNSYLGYKHGVCENNPTVNMGEYVPHNTTGIYFVDTNDRSPYSKT